MMTTRLFGEDAVQLIDVQAGRAYRLTTKVLEAFTLAYELEDVETAEAMLKAAEDLMVREGVHAFRQWGVAQRLVDAHFQLWDMRHRER